MSASTYSLRASLIATVTRFQRPDVPLWVAARNTAAVSLPLAVGFASGHPLAGLGIGAGALNVMFADQPGPYAQRLALILTVSVAAALSGLAGFLAGNNPELLPAVYALWGFAGGMLVLYGPRMTRVGMTSMILLIVATATPMHGRQALGASGLILAGGALQALFSVAAWPLRRYHPERLALASVYRDLARMARQPSRHDDAPPVSDTMTALQQTLLGRTLARSRAMEAFHTLLELAERMRLELMALDESTPDTHTTQRFHKATALVLESIALALDKGMPPRRTERLLDTVKAIEADMAQTTASRRHAHALIGQLAAAVRNSHWAGSQGEIRASQLDTSLPRVLRHTAPWAALRANLHFSSVAFRHGVRMAVVLALAGVLSQWLSFGHGYWLPMTVAIVLRPDFGSTFNIGLLRMLGTILGLVLTTVLLYFTPQNPWAHLAVMTVLCFVFRYLATAHYGVAVIALTGTVVILLNFEGVASDAAATERVLNTVVGCVLSLIAYRAWPTWERGRARHALANMLDTYAGYLHTLSSPDTGSARRDARTASRTARSNAQASLDRLRAEPATDSELMELATALFTAANRLIRSAMALEALLDAPESAPCRDAMHGFTTTVEQHLRELALTVREQRLPATLPSLREQQQALASRLGEHHEAAIAGDMITLTDRLTDNIGTLTHVLTRAAPDPA